jgi:hypothetical protein
MLPAMKADYPLADLDLARRLELAEAKTNAAFVDARAGLDPASGAAWIERHGALAMFDGVSSPLTQTFGLGMAGVPSDDDFDAIEDFFRSHGAPVFHEVSPLADPSLLALLSARGYQPLELTSVMFRPIEPLDLDLHGTSVKTRIAQPGEEDLWSATSARGWGESPELADFIRDIGRVSARARNTVSFFGEIDGVPVATGSMSLHHGVALMAGASTAPSSRQQGAQRALLVARLQHAAAQGADLAMMCAAPGSGSQRNAERQGFRIAYTRIKWQLTQD